MKPAEVRKLSDDELAKALGTSRAELFNLRFRLATGQLDDTSKIAIVKKDIARIQTESRARSLAAATAAVAETDSVAVGADA
ncbi:MAG: 50S ribosomal protein L29 [Actinomycetes bacterium]|jgi:large subunit ribosomal protein L29|nr:50S ribosomal protein L29 [Actinomycetes bacterium]